MESSRTKHIHPIRALEIAQQLRLVASILSGENQLLDTRLIGSSDSFEIGFANSKEAGIMVKWPTQTEMVELLSAINNDGRRGSIVEQE